jgi:hypothetical protein
MTTEWLTENDIVDAMAKHLSADGWRITNTCRTTEQGIDLIAIRDNERLVLEAKGGTSSKEGTRRFAKGFSPGQQADHVAKAVFVACKLRSREPESRVAIAFPDTPTHRRCILDVERVFKRL